MFLFLSLVSNPFASQFALSEEPPSLSTMPDDAPKETLFPFLRLSLELHEQIYSIYFRPADYLVRSVELEASGFFGGVY
jgi:hypothetical protein